MTPDEIESVLSAAESQIADRGIADLKALGFWKAVNAVKLQPELADRFADRMGAIDRAVFVAWAPLTISMPIGTALAVLGTVFGITLILMSNISQPWSGVSFLAGTAVLLAATHGLGHLAVGGLGGIRFTMWFAGYRRPQPGVKTDYATYLRASARARAWMHASGAVVTKAIPILLLPPAVLVYDLPAWAVIVLAVVAVGQIVTDVVWSTRSSDWAKYRREMSYADRRE